MALPPWTVELLRRGVADLARQVTDNDTAASLKEQASKLVEELPKTAREKVDTILRQAEESTRPIKDVWQSGVLWRGGTISLTPARLINGTGRLLDPRGSGVGLPAEALAAAIPHLSGDASHIENADARLCDEIAAAISRRCGEGSAENNKLSAIVTNSIDASLALIMKLGGRGGCVSVPRCCAVPLVTSTQGPASTSTQAVGDELLVDRLRRYGTGAVREFGRVDGSDRWDENHFTRRRGQHRDAPSNGRHQGGQRDGQHDDKPVRGRQNVLVRLAASGEGNRIPTAERANWIDVVVLPIGAIFSTGDEVSVDSLVDQLRGGADVVVLGGGVLAGTPELSLVVGNEAVIDQLRQTPRHSLVMAPTALTAIAASTVAIQASGRSPVGQLASVSEENLQDRAMRLATQLGGFDAVQSTRVTQDSASIGLVTTQLTTTTTSDAADVLPSRQVVLTLDASKDADAVARRLAESSIGLLCRVQGNEIIIDLRWISPEQQSQIGEIVGRAF
ncbi:selenocysteinyl-tRNA(Sec) synthase [Aporhodopirellula aestuarii]|uniref:Selenocysteinyl-tRNA(Sec) synthase n=1 Tax=Aporhodopirellula aestuarii TaxID=2950107 RepID=A0ABT0TYI6_9BACT|nr:selenocysteinyl-tRNA(Sec) synthase [Aporhodopirellula aestuarii]MCM2369661.1 selenocysteinyl-tRNA(Sec) synthase [Aporhodopirellula aestuarii]